MIKRKRDRKQEWPTALQMVQQRRDERKEKELSKLKKNLQWLKKVHEATKEQK